MSRDKNLPIDALIFDMDGVLIDVSRSYRQAIIQTVDLFFTTGLGLSTEDASLSLIDNNDISALKLAGGFNNDWDITAAFIIYFLEMLPPFPMHTFPLKRHVPAILAYLQVAMGHRPDITIDMLRRDKDIERLSEQVKKAGGGMDGLAQVLTHRNRHLISTGEDLLKGNLIKRIFQELYLGQELFEEIYGEKPVVTQSDGLIKQESLFISPAILKELAEELQLGIATGRPRAEAEYALRNLGIENYFHSLVTDDDLSAAEAKGKPAPWTLLEAARRLHPTPARSAYIGDTPDDIRAAKAANQVVPFLSIGCLAPAQDKEALGQRFEELGADIILNHPDRLPNIIFRS